MKASIKTEETQEAEYSNQKEVNQFEEDSYEAYKQQEDAKRKPYEEVIEYLKNNPKLSVYGTDDNGKPTTNALTADILMNWEDTHVNIYMSKIGDEPEIYVWRSLRRYEYLRAMKDDSGTPTVDWSNDLQRQSFIVKTCLLFPYPSFYFLNNSYAGTLSTLETQILYKSGFVPDREALQSITIIG